MRRLLILEYDGAAFCGWQWQPAGRSVQGELERALLRVTGERARPLGASRTDAGVHALGQAAHVDLESRLDDAVLARALAAVLPPDLVVRQVRSVASTFHARRDALRKEYHYRILDRRLRSPLRRGTSWHLRGPLALEPMRLAAAALGGTHDFSAFRGDPGRGAARPNPCRRLELDVGREGDLVLVRAAARGFLRHMVRNLAGTLAEVGLGRRDPCTMRALLESRDRSRAGPTAPAHGLCLVRVVYASEGRALTPSDLSAT
jgi:tRNA pseudouridine38-40 synthase